MAITQISKGVWHQTPESAEKYKGSAASSYLSAYTKERTKMWEMAQAQAMSEMGISSDNYKAQMEIYGNSLKASDARLAKVDADISAIRRGEIDAQDAALQTGAEMGGKRAKAEADRDEKRREMTGGTAPSSSTTVTTTAPTTSRTTGGSSSGGGTAATRTKSPDVDAVDAAINNLSWEQQVVAIPGQLQPGGQFYKNTTTDQRKFDQKIMLESRRDVRQAEYEAGGMSPTAAREGADKDIDAALGTEAPLALREYKEGGGGAGGAVGAVGTSGGDRVTTKEGSYRTSTTQRLGSPGRPKYPGLPAELPPIENVDVAIASRDAEIERLMAERTEILNERGGISRPVAGQRGTATDLLTRTRDIFGRTAGNVGPKPYETRLQIDKLLNASPKERQALLAEFNSRGRLTQEEIDSSRLPAFDAEKEAAEIKEIEAGLAEQPPPVEEPFVSKSFLPMPQIDPDEMARLFNRTRAEEMGPMPTTNRRPGVDYDVDLGEKQEGITEPIPEEGRSGTLLNPPADLDLSDMAPLPSAADLDFDVRLAEQERQKAAAERKRVEAERRKSETDRIRSELEQFRAHQKKNKDLKLNLDTLFPEGMFQTPPQRIDAPPPERRVLPMRPGLVNERPQELIAESLPMTVDRSRIPPPGSIGTKSEGIIAPPPEEVAREPMDRGGRWKFTEDDKQFLQSMEALSTIFEGISNIPIKFVNQAIDKLQPSPAALKSVGLVDTKPSAGVIAESEPMTVDRSRIPPPGSIGTKSEGIIAPIPEEEARAPMDRGGRLKLSEGDLALMQQLEALQALFPEGVPEEIRAPVAALRRQAAFAPNSIGKFNTAPTAASVSSSDLFSTPVDRSRGAPPGDEKKEGQIVDIGEPQAKANGVSERSAMKAPPGKGKPDAVAAAERTMKAAGVVQGAETSASVLGTTTLGVDKKDKGGTKGYYLMQRYQEAMELKDKPRQLDRLIASGPGLVAYKIWEANKSVGATVNKGWEALAKEFEGNVEDLKVAHRVLLALDMKNKAQNTPVEKAP